MPLAPHAIEHEKCYRSVRVGWTKPWGSDFVLYCSNIYTRARGCLVTEDQGEYLDHWTSVKLSKRGQTNEQYLKVHTYKWCQLMTIPSNTFSMGGDNHICAMLHALMHVCTQSVSRDARIHTLIPNTCTYCLTDYTHLSPIPSSGVIQPTSSFGCPSP